MVNLQNNVKGRNSWFVGGPLYVNTFIGILQRLHTIERIHVMYIRVHIFMHTLVHLVSFFGGGNTHFFLYNMKQKSNSFNTLTYSIQTNRLLDKKSLQFLI